MTGAGATFDVEMNGHGTRTPRHHETVRDTENIGVIPTQHLALPHGTRQDLDQIAAHVPQMQYALRPGGEQPFPGQVEVEAAGADLSTQSKAKWEADRLDIPGPFFGVQGRRRRDLGRRLGIIDTELANGNGRIFLELAQFRVDY